MMKPIEVEQHGMPGGGASLLERANAQRDEQVAALFDRRYVPMCRLAFVILGDHALAEEIVMEALLKTFAGWGRLREIDRASGCIPPQGGRQPLPVEDPAQDDRGEGERRSSRAGFTR